jgi:hypothetical protein
MEKLLGKWARLMRVHKQEGAAQLEEWVQEPERRSVRPPRLAWKQDQQGSESLGYDRWDRVECLNKEQSVCHEPLPDEANVI